MCTTLSQDVVVGTGGNVVVELVLVVVVDVVLLLDVVVVVDAADVDVDGAIDDGVVDEDESTPVVVTPPTSADWICSLHAGSSGIARVTHQARRRFTLPPRPKPPPPAATLRHGRAPSNRRDDR
jgi:hypothetical protein